MVKPQMKLMSTYGWGRGKEITCIEVMDKFAYATVKVFGPKYPREPTTERIPKSY